MEVLKHPCDEIRLPVLDEVVPGEDVGGAVAVECVGQVLRYRHRLLPLLQLKLLLCQGLQG